MLNRLLARLNLSLRAVGLVPLTDHTSVVADLVEVRSRVHTLEGELDETRGLLQAAEDVAEDCELERQQLLEELAKRDEDDDRLRPVLNGLILQYGEPVLTLDPVYLEAGAALPACTVDGEGGGATLTLNVGTAMPVNEQFICVLDFETVGPLTRKAGGLDCSVIGPAQLACAIICPRTLNPVSGSEFSSLLNPGMTAGQMNPHALRVNGLDPAELEKAPDAGVVWQQFAAHVKKYNVKGGFRGRPIACGKNIRNFDMPIVQHLAEKYKTVDKDGTQALFDQRVTLDLEDDLWRFFSASTALPSYKMDDVRTHLGLSADGAHSALVDVQQTALIISRFLKMYRREGEVKQFKGSMAGVA